MEREPSIEDVRRFWDANPLLTGELEHPVGSRKWFETFDRTKTEDVFCGDLSRWVPDDLEGKRVLDVGCGPGYWARIFCKQPCEYHGVDISPNTVALARSSLELHGLSGDLRVGNAEALPFEDKHFDYVVSEGVIHHTPDTQKCIHEIHRVLADEGRAAVSVYYKNALLKSPLLFRLTLSVMRALGVGLAGRGRECMRNAPTPEEFVRMYDGAENPIGRAYTKREMRSMFSRFSAVRLSAY